MSETERNYATLADEPDPGFPVGLVLSDRAFWAIFAGAWIAFTGINFSFIVPMAETASEVWLRTVINTGAPLIPSIYVATRRKRLLSSDITLGRFVARHVAGGMLFALFASGLLFSMGTLAGLDFMAEFEGTPYGENETVLAIALYLQSFFLYVMLLGFLLFTESMRKTQESREVAAREAVLRAQAEAKALRSQFNPHFVFNTLHSLMLLVRAEPDTAERAIEDVASLIRYASTLQRREVDQVTLAKELEFARRYVSLEKLRLDERLTVEWVIAEGLDDVLVPAFSLQTLLENSIKHGIEPKPQGGSVRIGAAIDNEDLLMRITDDGEGAVADEVTRNGGSGLQLLGQRMRTAYGDEGELSWSTRPGGGFETVVRVPLRRADSEAAPAL